MKSVIFVSIFSFLCFSVQAQNEKLDPVKLSGELLKKEWSKSTQSYCAQGSEYYVLQVNNSSRSVIIEFGNEKIKLSKLINQNVEVIGRHIDKTIPTGDGVTQEPINIHSNLNGEGAESKTNKPLTCKVFEVKEITLKK